MPAHCDPEDGDANEPAEEVEDAIEAIELDAIAFLAEQYGDDAWSDATAASDYIQSTVVAFNAFRSKGEGKGKQQNRYPVRPSHLSDVSCKS